MSEGKINPSGKSEQKVKNRALPNLIKQFKDKKMPIYMYNKSAKNVDHEHDRKKA